MKAKKNISEQAGQQASPEQITGGEEEALLPAKQRELKSSEAAVSSLKGEKNPSLYAVPPEASEDVQFSALNLRDRVVVMLFFNQVVRLEQVEEAWRHWLQLNQEGITRSLWRVLADHPEVDREAVFEEAARVYAFEEADLARHDVHAFVRERRDAFAEAQWKRLCELNVLPVQVEPHPAGGVEWTFATHDPTRAEINRLLKQLVDRFTLQYAPEQTVGSILAEAFPQESDRVEKAKQPAAQDAPYVPRFEEEQEKDEERPSQEAEEQSPLMELFEEMLVAAVDAAATKIYLFPNAREATEILFAIDDQLEKWRVEDEMPASAVMVFFKRDIIRRSQVGHSDQSKAVVQRWIGDVCLRFRVSTTKVEDGNKGVRTEMVTIEMLD